MAEIISEDYNALKTTYTNKIILTKYNTEKNLECNICACIRAENPDCSIPWYSIYTYENDCNICNICYDKIYTLAKYITHDKKREYVCSACHRYYNSTSMYKFYNINICPECFNLKTQLGVNINEPGFFNERCCYMPAEKLTAEKYNIPDELQNEIIHERNIEFIDLVNSVVELPRIKNILEWILITDMSDCISVGEARCGIIMNAVSPNHEIASIVSDDHDRCAINIIYDNYKDYINEKNIFLSLNYKEFNFEPYWEFSNDEDDDNSEMKFEEYIRRTRRYGFYYG